MSTTKAATRQQLPSHTLSLSANLNVSTAAETMTFEDGSRNPASLGPTTSATGVISSNSGTTGAFSVKNFFKMMKYERLRLITYLLYGHQWPKMEVISPTELAKAGFFYLNEDAVKCAFCRGVLRDWEPGEDAMEAHQRHFPHCPFVRGEYCGNMPFEIDPDINSTEARNVFKSPVEKAVKTIPPTISPAAAARLVPGSPAANAALNGYNKSDLPRYPKFSEPLIRAKSFRLEKWRSTAVSAEDLVDAGFFFINEDDRTRCFHCGGMLFNWAPGEVPLEEHAKFFPECHFLVSTRSQTYIEFVQFKTQIIELRKKLDSPAAVKEADIACMKAISYQNFLNMKQSASRVMNRLEKRNNQSCGAQNRAQNGSGNNGPRNSSESLSPDTSSSSAGSSDLNTFLQKYLSKFSFLTDCQKLFQYLTSLEIMQPQSPTSPTQTPESSAAAETSQASSDSFSSSNDGFSSSSSLGSNTGYNSPGSSGKPISISIFSLDDGESNRLETSFESADSSRRGSSSTTTSSISDEETESSTRKLTKNALQCIICCDRQIEIVFVPCGHQLACRKCSEKMTSCPICRLAIENKVRTYFAHC